MLLSFGKSDTAIQPRFCNAVTPVTPFFNKGHIYFFSFLSLMGAVFKKKKTRPPRVRIRNYNAAPSAEIVLSACRTERQSAPFCKRKFAPPRTLRSDCSQYVPALSFASDRVVSAVDSSLTNPFGAFSRLPLWHRCRYLLSWQFVSRIFSRDRGIQLSPLSDGRGTFLSLHNYPDMRIAFYFSRKKIFSDFFA